MNGFNNRIADGATIPAPCHNYRKLLSERTIEKRYA
jgi:hypothetical protein